MDELTTLEGYLKLINQTIRKGVCLHGIKSPCGCGIIHELMYVCNYHKSQLLLNTHLSMN